MEGQDLPMWALPTPLNIGSAPSVGSNTLNGRSCCRADMTGIRRAPVVPGYPITRIFGWSRPQTVFHGQEMTGRFMLQSGHAQMSERGY